MLLIQIGLFSSCTASNLYYINKGVRVILVNQIRLTESYILGSRPTTPH